MHLVDQEQEPTSRTFTTTDFARLVSYRAAVAAGFYSDWDGSAASTDTAVLAWLPRQETEYPFTEEERRALERLRTRLAEGELADDLPPAAPRPEDDVPPSEEPAEGD